jgi:hypothetical protein
MKSLLGRLRIGTLAQWPHPGAGSLKGRRSARLLLLTVLIATALGGFSQTPDIIPSIEAPGVQTSPLINNPQATGVFVEDFNSLPLGDQSKGFQSTLGMFSGGKILPAQPAGGAFETQFYQVSQHGLETLTFKTPERYFGLWWSDADPSFPLSNTLTFSLRSTSGLTTSFPFNTANLLHLISLQPNPSAYFGNPNPSTFDPATLKRAYAFVNFFAAQNVTINNVEFSNKEVTFSMDNLTVASAFSGPTPTPTPTPSPTPTP